jgi:hypothetical protein
MNAHGDIIKNAQHLMEMNCQGKVEMSPGWQSRNVPFGPVACGVHVNLLVPVKRRRALVATNPIE